MKENMNENLKESDRNKYDGNNLQSVPVSPDGEMVTSYPFFFRVSLIYAIFYVFCLYKNGYGITFPLLVAGSIAYFIICFEKMKVKRKRDSLFYLISMELFGISTFLTADYRLIFLNKIAILLLGMAFLLHTFYEDRTWNIVKYFHVALKMIGRMLLLIDRPFVHLSAYRKQQETQEKERKYAKIKYIFLGLVLGLPLLLVVFLLLLGADAVFAHQIEQIFEFEAMMEHTTDVVQIAFLFMVAFMASYLINCYFISNKAEEVKDYRQGEPIIAITIATVLSLLYLAFCGLQIRYLFLGMSDGNLALPEGMTYSEYAREGFFQLLFVCMINLFVVLAGLHLFRESKCLKVLLGIITVCTYIMIASSAYRMVLYIQYQYMTFLRIFVLWALVVIFSIMTGIFIYIIRPKFPLFRYSMVVVTALYLVLSFSKPDYFIAKINIDNMNKDTQYTFFQNTEPYDDYEFLAYNLGPDAAPVLLSQDVLQTWNEEKDNIEADEYQSGHLDYVESWYDDDYFNDMESTWGITYCKRMNQRSKNMSIRSLNVSLFQVKRMLNSKK